VAVAVQPEQAGGLSRRQIREARCSPQHFISLCMIQDGNGGPAIPFKLWDFQREVIHEIRTHPRLIFLKARQLGLSWLTLAYILWLCSCNEGQTALILNQGQRESEELLERIKFMLRRLPPELKPRLVKETTEQILFANGSRIYSLTAKSNTGSGMTAQFVMIDEMAKIEGIQQILVSVLPTLSAGGKLVEISTAQGYHNPFAKEWHRAVDGESQFWPCFIPWWEHPERDDAWYQTKREELATERDLLQEYPGVEKDAFQIPGETVFGDDFDRKRHVTQAMPAPDSQWPKHRGIDFGRHHSVHLWLEVQANRNVLVFAELHAVKRITMTMMEEVMVMDAELGVETSKAPAGCDPAGKAENSNAFESDHYTVERFGIPVVWEQTERPPRIQQIKQLLQEDRLKIHGSCKYLIEALEQAQWERAAKPTGSQSKDPAFKEFYQKDGVLDHPLDALSYALITIFPVTGPPAAARTTAPRGGGRKPTYSTSEYG
jgi:hypothetical protein